MEHSSQGMTDLDQLIQSMDPVLHPGEYVFATVQEIEAIPRSVTICEFREEEGTTVVLAREKAEELGLSFDYIAAWITLKVHSALDAVGLTAAFSSELAQHGISCNVIAGYYHDHIFVAFQDGERAVEVLRRMAGK